MKWDHDATAAQGVGSGGNTLTSGGKAFAYDFEKRLKSMNGTVVTLQYDGDGNRVAKTVAGVTTRYLVDDLNPTGYVQVVEEIVGSAVQRTYTYGLERISQNQLVNSSWTPSFYGYDGGDNVRTLTDATGTVTDTSDYDAWGNAVSTTGSTPNAYLYRGEQYDADLGLYYLRARYFNPVTGRFLSTDPADGIPTDPATLHKYLYASDDPINRIDPTGWQTITVNPHPSWGGGSITPEAGGYIHLSIGPLRWPNLEVQLVRGRDGLWGPCTTLTGQPTKPHMPELDMEDYREIGGCAAKCLAETLSPISLPGGTTIGTLPLVPKPMQTPGAAPNTAPISILLRKLLPWKLKCLRKLPQFGTGLNPGSRSISVGGILGRAAVPIMAVADYILWARCFEKCTDQLANERIAACGCSEWIQ